MNPIQQQRYSPNIYSGSQLDTTFNVSSSNVNAVQDGTAVIHLSFPSDNSTHFQENISLAEHSFFYRPPNDFQIYEIVCKETQISFEV